MVVNWAMDIKPSVKILINLSAVFIPCCPCIFLMSYGAKDLETYCRCFTCVCLFTEDEEQKFVDKCKVGAANVSSKKKKKKRHLSHRQTAQ